MPTADTLSGVRVLVTRTPERAAPLAEALTAEGAAVGIFPVIDYQQVPDSKDLDAALSSLLKGGFEWLVLTSVTAVMAVSQSIAKRGMSLVEALPATVRVAAVGAGTTARLSAEGIHVDLQPAEDQSANGLLGVWSAEPGRVLLPQADIAPATLAEGLAGLGSLVTAVVAYCTVDYPADPALALGDLRPPSAHVNAAVQVLLPQHAAETLMAGQFDVVIAASPSAIRRITALAGPLPATRLVAIGATTAQAARERGMNVAAVAVRPTVEGLVAATLAAVAAQPVARSSSTRAPRISSTCSNPPKEIHELP